MLSNEESQNRIKTLLKRCDTEGSLVSCPELEVYIKLCSQALSNDYFKRIENQVLNNPTTANPEFKFMLEQRHMMRLQIYHVSMKVMLRDGAKEDGYPHVPPTAGRYPFRTTLDAIAQVNDFFECLKHVSDQSEHHPRLDPSVTLFLNEYRNLNTRLSTSETNQKKPIVQAQSDKTSPFSYEKKLIEHPADSYYELKTKILTEGLDVSTPEFSEVTKTIIQKMRCSFICDVTKNYPFCEAVRNNILQTLYFVQINGYPYIQTINALKKALDFFDALERTYKDNISPLYHTDRYTYYAQTLPYNTDYVVVPSTMPLSFLDLIKLRTAPIAMMGVITSTVFADGYFNSPKDFWVHDANHNRRFHSYNQIYKNRTGKESYHDFEQFLKETILPAIEINEQMSEEEIQTRKMMTVVLFEFLHEFAYTPDRESLIEAFKFKSGQDKGPFEIIHSNLNSENKTNLEDRRLPNNNLESGVKMFSGDGENHPELIVEYFFDRIGLNFLRTIANKFEKAFYENTHWGIYAEDLPKEGFRTPEHIAKAAMKVMALYSIDPVKDLGFAEDVCQKLMEIETEKVETDRFGKDLFQKPAYNTDLLSNSIFKPKAKLIRSQSESIDITIDNSFK